MKESEQGLSPKCGPPAQTVPPSRTASELFESKAPSQNLTESDALQDSQSPLLLSDSALHSPTPPCEPDLSASLQIHLLRGSLATLPFLFQQTVFSFQYEFLSLTAHTCGEPEL